MIPLPTAEKELIPAVNELIETCNVSQGSRAAYYRLLSTIAETGRADGTKALINMLNSHLERTASHLFSPVELKFSYDFDNEYKPEIDQARAGCGQASDPALGTIRTRASVRAGHL